MLRVVLAATKPPKREPAPRQSQSAASVTVPLTVSDFHIAVCPAGKLKVVAPVTLTVVAEASGIAPSITLPEESLHCQLAGSVRTFLSPPPVHVAVAGASANAMPQANAQAQAAARNAAALL